MLVGMNPIWAMSLRNSTRLEMEVGISENLVRSKRDGGAITAAIIGASAVLASGATGLAASSLKNSDHKGYNRNFEGRIENLLEWPLINPRSSTWYGYVSSPPTVVRSCEIGVVAGHKKGHTATGSSGIVSWKVAGQDLTVIVFWSVPYSGQDCNSLGLGIYKGLSANEPSWDNRYDYIYDLYYYHDDSPSISEASTKTLSFESFCRHTNEFCTSNYGIWVCGTMSNNAAGKFDIRIGAVENPMYCVGDSTGRTPEERP